MPTPATVTGTLQALTSGKIAQGKVIFQLTNTGTGNAIGVFGTSIIPQLTYTLMTDQSGGFSTQLWGNDNITPANTLYAVTFRDYQGNETGPVLYSIVGASFNLNSATPVSNVLPPVYTTGAVVLNPTAPQIISGAFPLITSNLNDVLYVGGGITTWSGADIGAQINSAYAALPTTGGTIIILPQATPYAFTTPILFTTSGKYVLLMGWTAPGNQSAGLGTAGSMGGVTLNYTPTTATSAITMDYVPTIGGGGAMTHGLRDLTIFGGAIGSLVIGGSGNLSTGILIGTTNSGMQNGIIQGCRIAGFGTGVNFATPVSGVSWGVCIRDCGIVANTTGILYNGSFEKQYINNCMLIFNATAILDTAAPGSSLDVFISDCSIDTNTVNGINQSTNSHFFLSRCHLENLGSTGTPQIPWAHFHLSAGGSMYYSQCWVLDDRAAGAAQDYYFKTTGGGVMSFIDVFLFQGAGQPPSTTVISATSGTSVYTKFNDTSVIRSPVLVTGTIHWSDETSGIHQVQRINAHSGTALVAGDFSLGAGWGSTATITGITGTDQAWQALVTANGAGIAASPVILFTFHDGTWTNAPICISKVNGGTGLSTIIVTDLPSATNNLITYQGTPSAGFTYLISSIAMGR